MEIQNKKIIDNIFEYRPEKSICGLNLSDGSILALIIFLLIIANVFRAYAQNHYLQVSQPFIMALGISMIYLIFQYSFLIHANSIGYSRYSIYTLRVLQSAISLVVFVGVAWWSFKTPPNINHLASLGLIFTAIWISVLGDKNQSGKIDPCIE